MSCSVGLPGQFVICVRCSSGTSTPIDVSNRIPRFVTRELEAMNYEIIRWAQSYAFGWVHGIRIDDGVWSGGADPATDGMALAI